jgi:hypothetical protein
MRAVPPGEGTRGPGAAPVIKKKPRSIGDGMVMRAHTGPTVRRPMVLFATKKIGLAPGQAIGYPTDVSDGSKCSTRTKGVYTLLEPFRLEPFRAVFYLPAVSARRRAGDRVEVGAGGA